MEILDWLNRLGLGDDLFGLVDKHYLKTLLFVKFTRGCDVTVDDVKDCKCDFNESTLTVEIKFKKKIDVPELTQLVEENIHNFDYSVDVKGNTMIVAIHSDKEEVYTVANLLNAHA